MLVYAELPSYGAWEFIDIPYRYILTYVTVSVFYLESPWRVYCHRLGVSLRETLCLSKRVSVLSNILKRTKSYPLTVDSLQNPRILTKAFVIFIVCYTS